MKKCHASVASSEPTVEVRPEPSPAADNASFDGFSRGSGPDLFPAQDISWFMKLPQYVMAYFGRFHPGFPALHQPSFDVTAVKEPLLQAVACIGAVYHSPSSDHSISKALFEAGYKSLNRYVQEDRSRFREVWVIQAFILFEYFAIYSCRDDLFSTSLSIHRRLVDAAREYQMLQDGVAMNGSDAGLSPDQVEDPVNGFISSHATNSVEERWKAFIDSESQKR